MARLIVVVFICNLSMSVVYSVGFQTSETHCLKQKDRRSQRRSDTKVVL